MKSDLCVSSHSLFVVAGDQIIYVKSTAAASESTMQVL